MFPQAVINLVGVHRMGVDNLAASVLVDVDAYYTLEVSFIKILFPNFLIF